MPMSRWYDFNEHVGLAPESPGVYELGDAKQVTVYIGKSTDSIKSRLLSHRKMKRFMKVKYYRFRKVEYPSDATKLEYQLYTAYKKSHNGKPPRLNTSTPPKPQSSWLFGD